MKELALKQQRASQEAEDKASESQLPPSSGSPTIRDHTSPPTPQTDGTTAEPPARAETPLERTLLEQLNDKDLGATGFVTASELSAVLISLPDDKAVCACVCVCQLFNVVYYVYTNVPLRIASYIGHTQLYVVGCSLVLSTRLIQCHVHLPSNQLRDGCG